MSEYVDSYIEKYKPALVKTEKYRPSNGSEGSWFEDNICGKWYDNKKPL